MAAVRGGGRGKARLQEGEAPEAHVAEEGKRVIRDLVARQTDTAASLELQRAREGERQFRRAAAVLPLDGATAGTSSLRDFTESAERAKRAEQLANTGLPLHDLQLLLEHECGAAAAQRLTEPECLAREERLRDIRRRLAASAAEDRPTSPELSRHVQELSSALRLDGEMSPFVRLALDQAQAKDRQEVDVPRFRDAPQPAPGHPVHRLVQLERGMFARRDDDGVLPPAATSRKRRRQRQVADGQNKTRDAAASSSEGSVGAGTGGSLWDVRTAVPVPKPAPSKPITTRPLGPARPKQYTVVDGRIVELKGGAVAALDRTREDGSTDAKLAKGNVFVPTGQGFLTEEELQKNRLSVEEIRKLPRFASYQEGTPSSVLYVKNLDAAVTEDDLAAVFGSFRASGEPSPTLRLCGGRMRGQAFITFSTEAGAGAALRAANGYVLRGKPVIVQYGRGQGSDL